jgi:hypothetical protein
MGLSPVPLPAHVVSNSTALQEPWHRTVYEDEAEGQTNLLFQALGIAADFTSSLQLSAVNTIVQLMVRGTRMGASATRSLLSPIPTTVPLLSVATEFVDRVDLRASNILQEANAIAGTRESPAGSETGMVRKLAADMVLGPATGLIALPLTVASEFAGAAAATEPGQAAAKAASSVINAALDSVAVSGSPSILDSGQIRDAWLAMTTGPGKTALGNLVHFCTAAARLSIGDTRSMAKVLDDAAVSFNYGLQYGRQDLLYPRVPVGEFLADLSGAIVRYLPATVISALRTGDLWKTVNASLEDGENVFLSAVSYPAGMFLVAANVGRFLVMGLRDCNDIDRYVHREMDVVRAYPELGTEQGIMHLLAVPREAAARTKAIQALVELEKKRPFSCTEFEFYVGNARSLEDPESVAAGLLNHSTLPAGVFSQDVIDLAQDTAFYYSSKLLGRDAALIRMLRLYGPRVRDRLAADPTLETDAGLDEAQIKVLLDRADDSPEKLDRLCTLAEEKVRSFDRLEANPDVPVPAQVRKRRRFYLKLMGSIERREPRDDTHSMERRAAP